MHRATTPIRQPRYDIYSLWWALRSLIPRVDYGKKNDSFYSTCRILFWTITCCLAANVIRTWPGRQTIAIFLTLPRVILRRRLCPELLENFKTGSKKDPRPNSLFKRDLDEQLCFKTRKKVQIQIAGFLPNKRVNVFSFFKVREHLPRQVYGHC